MKLYDISNHEPLPDLYFCLYCGHKGNCVDLSNQKCPVCHKPLDYDYSEVHYTRWEVWEGRRLK